MTLYVVVCEDRHSDDGIYIYADKDKALAKARSEADEAVEHYHSEPDEELNALMIQDGWIFYSSIEDAGSVRVETKELVE